MWYLRTDQGTFADCSLDWWPNDETMKFGAEGIYMLVICSSRASPDGDGDGGGQGQDVVSAQRLPSDGVVEAPSPQEEEGRNWFGLFFFPSEDGTYCRVGMWRQWFTLGYENLFDQFEMSEVNIF